MLLQPCAWLFRLLPSQEGSEDWCSLKVGGIPQAGGQRLKSVSLRLLSKGPVDSILKGLLPVQTLERIVWVSQ